VSRAPGRASAPPPEIRIAGPDWVAGAVDWDHRSVAVEERMLLAIALAGRNVERGTGGPFGAAVFERDSGRLVSVGVNSVVRLNNSVLHAEIVALMMAQRRLGSYSLAAPGLPAHELVTSCDPCAMCLGAALWSGVTRLVCGAAREDAAVLHFDEGPVFPESYDYLRDRGVEVVRLVCRDEARAVLDVYRRGSGPIYNP